MNGRALLAVWGVLAAMAVLIAGTLQALGPPRAVARVQAAPRVARSIAAVPSRASGMIAPPDKELLAAMPDAPGRMLPVIAPDGRMSSSVYAAAPVAVLPNQARLALMVDGVGLDEATSRAAIVELPAPVDFAFSPYADDRETLARAARAHGHEMLVSIPMEPQGSPLNDEGDRQLSPANDAATNQRHLLWALSSLEGYVGATAADAGQSGEHVLGDAASLAMVARALGERGLMFVDPRTDGAAPAGVSSVRAASVIDGDAELVDQEAQLGALVARAQRDGQAVGIAGPLRPVTLARLIAWVRTLPGQGVVLVPVSTLAAAPAVEVTESGAASDAR